MRANHLISASVWVLTLTALVAAANAQGRGGRAPAMETLNSDVTVMTVSPRALQVTTADLEKWIVSIPTGPEDVVFRGTATTQFLQPGMALRFHATFKKTEKRRREYQTTQPISQLEIISVSENSQPGLYPDDAAGHEGWARDDDNEGEEERGKKKEHEDEKANEKEEAQEDAHAAAADISCLVIGILQEYKNNKIKVSAGRFPVTAEMPETAEVSVDVRHALWVRPGDKIELTARFLPAMRGRAEGQRMTITAAAPLAPDEKATKGRRRTRDKKEDAPKKTDAKFEPAKEPAKEKNAGKDDQ
jgi:hypothetical protein